MRWDALRKARRDEPQPSGSLVGSRRLVVRSWRGAVPRVAHRVAVHDVRCNMSEDQFMILGGFLLVQFIFSGFVMGVVLSKLNDIERLLQK